MAPAPSLDVAPTPTAADGTTPRPGRAIERAATLLALACVPVGLLLLGDGDALAGGAVLSLGTGVAIAALLARGRSEAIRDRDLRRAGISIWIEDWTEVGKVILSLRAEGRDVQAHFAAHPELFDQLHRTVRITDVNDSTLDFTGAREKSRLIGRLADVVPASAQTFERWIAAMARGDRVYRSESRVRRLDGELRDCLVTAVLPRDLEGFGNLLVSIIDISDYKADQARLAIIEREASRASRAATVGVLTASIAHEVKSPLAAVVTNAEAALRWLRRPAPDLVEAEAAIGAVVGDALRARDVVDRTRLLLTNAPHTPAELEIVDAIRSAALLVDRELRAADAILRVRAEPGTPRVMADVSRLRQVVTNLLLNAAQAMADSPRPREILIRAQADGEDVRVEVADTGTGIAPDRITRIFEPFYSTKEDGIGVGLAICRACVEAHGGRLWATSVPGAGATFHFTLPAAPA